MGYYIETSGIKNKAKWICDNLGGTIIEKPSSFNFMKFRKGQDALICVVNNGAFEAAGYCYSEREFEVFSDPSDPRQKTWVALNKEVAERESGYKIMDKPILAEGI